MGETSTKVFTSSGDMELYDFFFYNMKVYRTFIGTVLSYIMQLAENPSDLEDCFRRSHRLFAPGPGNWITAADATHLDSSYFFFFYISRPGMDFNGSKT